MRPHRHQYTAVTYIRTQTELDSLTFSRCGARGPSLHAKRGFERAMFAHLSIARNVARRHAAKIAVQSSQGRRVECRCVTQSNADSTCPRTVALGGAQIRRAAPFTASALPEQRQFDVLMWKRHDPVPASRLPGSAVHRVASGAVAACRHILVETKEQVQDVAVKLESGDDFVGDFPRSQLPPVAVPHSPKQHGSTT